MQMFARIQTVPISLTIFATACNIATAGIVYTFTLIDGPSPGLGGQFTFVQGISDTHLVVGYAFPNDPCTYSFVFDGTTFHSPLRLQANLGFPISCVQAQGINNGGQIVGTYGFQGANVFGFLLEGDVFTPIGAVPNSPKFYPSTLTLPRGISNIGLVVGDYVTASGTHGFVHAGGFFWRFDVPGALQTYARGINDFGKVVGYYSDATGDHGFVKFIDSLKRLDYPGALDTYANGINDFTTVVGTYVDTSQREHGFIYEHGRFTSLDVPSNVTAQQVAGSISTQLTGINNRGQIVGNWFLGQYHGFLASPATILEVMPQDGAGPIRLDKPLVTATLFSTPKFDAPATVNTATLTFGHTGTEQSLATCRVAGNDQKNFPHNLVCTFSTSATALQCGDTTARLTGELFDGTPIGGTDRVQVVPCPE